MRDKKTSRVLGVLASLIGLISPVSSKTICTLTSEEETNVPITMKFVPASVVGLESIK